MIFDDFLFSGCIRFRLNHALHLEWQRVLWKRPETNLMIMIFCEDVSPEKGNGPVEYLQQKIIEWRESPLLSLQLCKVLTLIIPPPWSWSPTRLPTPHRAQYAYNSVNWSGFPSIKVVCGWVVEYVPLSCWGHRTVKSWCYSQIGETGMGRDWAAAYIHLEKKKLMPVFWTF